MLLFEIAEKNNIDVDFIKTRELSSFSIPNAIAMDMSKMRDSADAATHLAHELGHCMTGAFYSRYTPFDIKERAEYKADKWAITNLISFSELRFCFEHGITERYALAEHFGVNEDFIDKVLSYYEEEILSLKEIY